MKNKLAIACIMLQIFCITSMGATSTYQVIRLIGDLNGDPESNKDARKELNEIGYQATSQLISEIEKYTSLKSSDILSAARCFRALKEMDSPVGIEAATKSLKILISKPNVTGGYQRVLLAEAIGYLSSQADNTLASKALLKFIQDYPEKYENSAKSFYQYSEWKPKSYKAHSDLSSDLNGRTGLKSGYHEGWTSIMQGRLVGKGSIRWQGGYSTSHSLNRSVRNSGGYTLFVDVYEALASMAKENVPGTEKALITLLERHPYKITLYLERLGKDGFTPGVYLSRINSNTKKTWIDENGRPRIALMKLLMEAGSHDALPSLEKMLKSKHGDERQQALITLEHITKNGKSLSHTNGTEEPSVDRIVLRNGDVLTGKIINETIKIKTSYAELSVATEEIANIQIETSATKTDEVRLLVGDRLSGIITDEEIKIELKAGGETSIKKSDIDNIHFGR